MSPIFVSVKCLRFSVLNVGLNGLKRLQNFIAKISSSMLFPMIHDEDQWQLASIRIYMPVTTISTRVSCIHVQYKQLLDTCDRIDRVWFMVVDLLATRMDTSFRKYSTYELQRSIFVISSLDCILMIFTQIHIFTNIIEISRIKYRNK